MNYTEIVEKSLTVKWKVGICPQGENCWCRVIIPEEPLFYKENEEDEPNEYWVSKPGELDGITVEHLVKIHNQSLHID